MSSLSTNSSSRKASKKPPKPIKKRAGYFTDVYGKVYDATMLQNAMQSDTAEAVDLMNIQFITRVLLLGVFPSVLAALLKGNFPSFKKNVLVKTGAL